MEGSMEPLTQAARLDETNLSIVSTEASVLMQVETSQAGAEAPLASTSTLPPQQQQQQSSASLVDSIGILPGFQQAGRLGKEMTQRQRGNINYPSTHASQAAADELGSDKPAMFAWKSGKGAGDAEIKKVFTDEEIRLLPVEKIKQLGFGRIPTGYCYSTRMLLHHPLQQAENKDDQHPEKPERITKIYAVLSSNALIPRMQRVAIREAVKEEVLLTHSEAHWNAVQETAQQDIEILKGTADYYERLSLYVNQNTALCARLSCGGVIEMAKAIAEGTIRNGFAIVRPPGHHAEPQDASGFCFYNNVAVAARWLRSVYGPQGGMNKVMIIDWDVHHGNGTQRAFWEDDDILYVSVHRHGDNFYPGGNYGAADQVGEGKGEGLSVNVPFEGAGLGDSDYIYAFQRVIMPIAYEFDPDYVIVSAGYDAADGDPLGGMKVSPAGFAHMTHMLSVLAKGKLLLALEGGYNVDAIASCALECVKVLLGDEPPELTLNPVGAVATEAVHEVTQVQAKHWKSMGAAALRTEDMMAAGPVIELAEILKSHRTAELYEKYSLHNPIIGEPEFENAYRNQLLVSKDLYTNETLVLFMHDMGTLKAAWSPMTLDMNLERTYLLDTSRLVLDWARKERKFAVMDVNFLAHPPSAQPKGQTSGTPWSNAKRDREFAFYMYDNIVALTEAKNIVLVGVGGACTPLIALLKQRNQIKSKVKACICVLGQQAPPEFDLASGMRPWYSDHSLVLLPASHRLHVEADRGERGGKILKKYGNVKRVVAAVGERPLNVLNAGLDEIRVFVNEKIPLPPAPAADISLANGSSMLVVDDSDVSGGPAEAAASAPGSTTSAVQSIPSAPPVQEDVTMEEIQTAGSSAP